MFGLADRVLRVKVLIPPWRYIRRRRYKMTWANFWTPNETLLLILDSFLCGVGVVGIVGLLFALKSQYQQNPQWFMRYTVGSLFVASQASPVSFHIIVVKNLD